MQNRYLLILLFIFIISAIKSQTLSDSLKAHYRFDNDLLDATSFGHDLMEISGIISYEVIEGMDHAINFTGSSGISSISNFDNSNYNAIAISLWMNSTTITTDLQKIIQGANMGFGVYLEENTGKVFGLFDGSSQGSFTSSSSVTDGNWHHIVAQSNGSETSLFIDGVFIGSISETMIVGDAGVDNKIYMGESNLGVQNYTGLLNEVRIYNRVLSDCEIGELYSQYANLPVAHYAFEGNLIDSSDNNYNQQFIDDPLTFEEFSMGDSAIVFDGESGITSVGNFDNSNFSQITIALWLKTTNVSSELQKIIQGANMGFGIYLEENTGKVLGFFDGGSPGSLTSSLPVTDGNWHHIVAQSDGSYTYLYLDGIKEGNIEESMTVGDGGVDNKLFMGISNLGIQGYTGSLNEVLIYDRLLSECEIDSLATLDDITQIQSQDFLQKDNSLIYPNPTAGLFNIDLTAFHEDVNMTITDFTGRMVQELVLAGNRNCQLHLPKESGIYLVTVYDNQIRRTFRVVKHN